MKQQNKKIQYFHQTLFREIFEKLPQQTINSLYSIVYGSAPLLGNRIKEILNEETN